LENKTEKKKANRPPFFTKKIVWKKSWCADFERSDTYQKKMYLLFYSF